MSISFLKKDRVVCVRRQRRAVFDRLFFELGFAPRAIAIFMTAMTMMQKQTQGMRLVLMILPSLPLVPVVAQAETTLSACCVLRINLNDFPFHFLCLFRTVVFESLCRQTAPSDTFCAGRRCRFARTEAAVAYLILQRCTGEERIQIVERS